MDDASFRTEILALAASAANADESLTLADFVAIDPAWHTHAATKKIVNELIASGQLVRRGSRYFGEADTRCDWCQEHGVERCRHEGM